MSPLDEGKISWENIPDSEKVSPEEIDALDAKCQGVMDGLNHQINKRVREAAASGNPTENLRKIREDLNISEPIYGVNVIDFIKANREILYSRVEKNFLAAAYEALTVLGPELTNALFDSVKEEVEKEKKQCLR